LPRNLSRNGRNFRLKYCRIKRRLWAKFRKFNRIFSRKGKRLWRRIESLGMKRLNNAKEY
jgi:hypothetical protein